MNIQVEEMHRTRYIVRDTKLPCSLWVHHSPYTFMYSPTRKFSKPHAVGIFMEASPHRHDQLLTAFPAPYSPW